MASNGDIFEDLTSKEEKAAIAVGAGLGHDEAAKAGGLSSRQLSRLKNEERFLRAVKKVKQDLYAESICQLVAAMASATTTLVAIASNEEAPASARVTAARSILDIAVKAYGQAELEARIELLEATLNVK